MHKTRTQTLNLSPIGNVKTEVSNPPRHWSISEASGTLVIDPEYTPGLKGIKTGDEIVVLFYFDRSPPFTPELLQQQPPHLDGERRGVFAICSPKRPNPIGMSILKITTIDNNRLEVLGIDMHDGTPILDIKPHIRA